MIQSVIILVDLEMDDLPSFQYFQEDYYIFYSITQFIQQLI
jgi:hypothetical protein